jgi:sulfide dehydrogenase cytochrome subunit
MLRLQVFLFLLLILSFPARGNDTDLASVIGECESCHGPGGASTDSDVPIIGGQSQSLIEKAHEQFRDRERPCTRTQYRHGDTDRPPTSMCEVAGKLDAAGIEKVASHFAALEFIPARQPFDENLAVAGAALHQLYCDSCHPKGGSEPGFAGRLAGQWTPYLARTIEQIKRAEVLVPHIMERKVNEFSDGDIEALLNFWASQQE